MTSSWIAWPTAAVAGLGLWSAVSLSMGGGEPWDASRYWTLACPAALALSLALGLAFPMRAWRWGAAVMLAQVPVVVAVSGIGPLLAAGVVYAVVLAVPAMLASAIGGWCRRKLHGRASRSSRDGRSG
ncbi:hypothetical protein MNO14_03000 [Luteimonas sp. S4-F44]|uniref:hypothetical protein n=1 Tax=Luteimonas sp. S4-F44 TaxID=2925842 RepID=UPI001F53000B|nr:hypothetical protein [Luteimonas sp. S4-F44]UNK43084.1 hypothetical protein MNO14_03000 [Luteimonas sp. S4-F44]